MASGNTKDVVKRSNLHSNNVMRVVDRRCDVSAETQQLIDFVFNVPQTSFNTEEERLSLKTLSFFINRVLATAQHTDCIEPKTPITGRLGPDQVVFNSSGCSGVVVVEADGLGIILTKYSTPRLPVKATSAQYEQIHVFMQESGNMKSCSAQRVLCSWAGVQQIVNFRQRTKSALTLSNLNTQQERDGVGDTDLSYAYDGNRIRKWNSKMHTSYGEFVSKFIEPDDNIAYRGDFSKRQSITISFSLFQALDVTVAQLAAFRILPHQAQLKSTFVALPNQLLQLASLNSWVTGDIIGVAIDCDDGKVTFTRNGRSLGDAFTDLTIGQGYAYFPAISLSMAENVHVNFGGRPLRFPIAGYRALQFPPTADILCSKSNGQLDGLSAGMQKRTALMILAAHVLTHLGPLLTKAYIVEECLLPHLLEKYSDQFYMDHLLDILWTFLQDSEMKLFLEHLTVCILYRYRFSVVDSDFVWQERYLLLLHSVVNHQRTRHHLLLNVLFDIVKLPYFMHIENPDDGLLKEWIPNVWWNPKLEETEGCDNDTLTAETSLNEEDQRRQSQFIMASRDLREKVRKLEASQTNILITLLNATDIIDESGACSRSLFLKKFRQFLREHYSPSHIRVYQLNMCPTVVLCYFFSRLLEALLLGCCPSGCSVSCKDVVVPFEQFYNEKVDYWDTPRLGGLATYLRKVHKAEIECMQSAGDVNSLSELVDDIVLLYNIAVHKQLAKTSAMRETYQDYITALTNTELKLASCPVELNVIYSELENSRRVFVEKTVAQSRIMAWVRATMCAEERIDDLKWLFRCLLRTIRHASENGGSLFSFVPEFYAEACINTYNALTTYFSPSLLCDQSPEGRELFTDYANFICSCFCDSRVISSDVRETLIQALGCLVCYPASVEALENIPLESQLTLTRTLLTVYENRPWAQTNWIVVKLWKGCGFAYRYTQLPHMEPTKNKIPEIGTTGMQKPCPSVKFQQHFRDVLRSDIESATKLVDSMINQLNWAFSEFVRLLQENLQPLNLSYVRLIKGITAKTSVVEQLIIRPTGLQRSFIDERQLKICATCFDISVGLLRALEMVINLLPEMFVDWTNNSYAELLLRRLLQMLTQVLIRVTGRSNTFDKVSSLRLPGLESVDHFPILVAVVGILVKLVNNTEPASQQSVLAALISEPGFQLSSVEFLFGNDDGLTSGAASDASDQKIFSLTTFKEVSSEEVKQMKQLLSLIRGQVEHTCAQEVAEDLLCNICYAQVKSVVFKPCRHQSCRACITHQMLSRNECFFCKSKIDEVIDISDCLAADCDTFYL